MVMNLIGINIIGSTATLLCHLTGFNKTGEYEYLRR